VRELISERTKAVMVCHFAGLLGRLDEVHQITAEHGLRVIEDAAHAIGTRNDGRRVGSTGDLVCFSFGPVKTTTTLEGGAITSPRPEELQTLHEFVRNRQDYCRGYNQRLAGIPEVIVPDSDYKDVGPFIYYIRVPGEVRQDLIDFLKQRGIPTGIHFLGAHEFTYYRDARRGGLSVTDRVTREELTLPRWSYMDDAVLDRVAGGIAEFFGQPSGGSASDPSGSPPGDTGAAEALVAHQQHPGCRPGARPRRPGGRRCPVRGPAPSTPRSGRRCDRPRTLLATRFDRAAKHPMVFYERIRGCPPDR
jgi:dTDP-4-amino-4,6-dideoxygalactose transaminase